jgi:hypothetical protein
MRAKSMLTVGFLALMATTGVANVSDSVAAESHRVDVIESPNETVTQLDSNKPGGESIRVDVIEGIGPEGPAYPYSKPMSH